MKTTLKRIKLCFESGCKGKHYFAICKYLFDFFIKNEKFISFSIFITVLELKCFYLSFAGAKVNAFSHFAKYFFNIFSFFLNFFRKCLKIKVLKFDFFSKFSKL